MTSRDPLEPMLIVGLVLSVGEGIALTVWGWVEGMA